MGEGLNSLFRKIAVVSLALMVCLSVVACSRNEDASQADKEKIKVGCFPSTDVFPKLLKENLADDYDVEVVVFDGNNIPCEALNSKEIDAVVGNGDKWLNTFNKENNTDLVMIDPFYSYFYALYSEKYENPEEFPQNAKIAIANDPTNTNNALKLLQNAELIELRDKPSDGELYSKMDIVKNDKNLEFVQMDLTVVAKNLSDVDGAVVSAVLIQEAGHDPLSFLALPNKEDLQKDGLIIRSSDKDKQWVKDAIEVSHKEENSKELMDQLNGTAFLVEKTDAFYSQNK